MRRMLPALVLGLLLFPAGPADAQPKAGTYELVNVTPTGGTIVCLVRIAPKANGLEGEFVATMPTAASRMTGVASVALDGDRLRVVFKGVPAQMAFEGRVPAAGADGFLGVFEVGGRPNPARMTLTDKTELTAANATVAIAQPPQMYAAQEIAEKVRVLRNLAVTAADADARARWQKEAAEAEADQAKPFAELIEKHPDSMAVLTAGQFLLRRAGANKTDAARVRGWADTMLKVGRPYGARYEAELATQVAEHLSGQIAYADLFLDYALRADQALDARDSVVRQARVLNLLAKAQKMAGRTADAERTIARVVKLDLDRAVADEKALTDTDPLDKQATVLGALAVAQNKLGMKAEAALTEARLAKIDAELDRAYLATVPPFKPTAFAGRKANSDRAVVMELFTGAQCPPCVAADVAFDALSKTYKPADVVLIQYHLHIPGPDPMTNPNSEARALYYGVHSTPSTYFNGSAQVGGGGAMSAAENKYNQYRGILDKLLEEMPPAAVKLGAARQGDVVTVKADVSKLAEPSADKTLRFLLVEESIRFVGNNKLRFHHMVVRAMPGGPDGVALTKADSQHTASVNLAELRKDLTKYLDDYTAEKRAFPQPQRPMHFTRLKAIALVQDDRTREILQAVIVDVSGTHAEH